MRSRVMPRKIKENGKLSMERYTRVRCITNWGRESIKEGGFISALVKVKKPALNLVLECNQVSFYSFYNSLVREKSFVQNVNVKKAADEGRDVESHRLHERTNRVNN